MKKKKKALEWNVKYVYIILFKCCVLSLFVPNGQCDDDDDDDDVVFLISFRPFSACFIAVVVILILCNFATNSFSSGLHIPNTHDCVCVMCVYGF